MTTSLGSRAAASVLADPDHACPVCGDRSSVAPLCQVDGYTIFVCRVCGADHVFPAPDERDLKAYYDRPEWFEAGEKGGYSDYDAQTTHSIDHLNSILDEFVDRQGLSVLDIGCGYGTHLSLAAERGWKCFGVEISDYARAVAKSRLGRTAHIVGALADLVPHQFDLILMLDVIEHLPSPYAPFYSLFSIGAVAPATRLVIATPNAGGSDASTDPASWIYRHPPSHLVLYTAEAIQLLLRRLRFTTVDVRGIHPLRADALQEPCFQDFAGLLVTASGSDFAEFMRERYVPGTWSKIAEYEHLPRYALARTIAVGKTVVDFGCGTGYGTAMLASVASEVLGLDIDQGAISWASETHSDHRLHFVCRDDLGAGLPAGAFDLVTCFEMIEHVDHATQTATIANITRLLREDGILMISTPNPEVTKLYGENPYHVREMTLPEFLDLLGEHFAHVRILEQRVRNSIAFAGDGAGRRLVHAPLQSACRIREAAAFVAICSRRPFAEVSPTVYFDEEADLTGDFLARERALNAARFEAYRLGEQVQAAERERDEVARRLGAAAEAVGAEVERLHAVVRAKDEALGIQGEGIGRLNDAHLAIERALSSQAAETDGLKALLLAREGDLGAQNEEIGRLNEALRMQEQAALSQSAEVHQLNVALMTRDEVLRTQAEENGRLNESLRAQQQQVSRLTAEAGRLNAMVLAKGAALDSQAAQIGRLNDTLQAQEQQLARQAAEVARLNAVLSAEDEALCTQTTKIKRLNDALLALERKHSLQAADVERLNDLVVAKDEALAAQADELLRLGAALGNAHTALAGSQSAMQQLSSELTALRMTKWFRLRDALIREPWSVSKFARAGYLLGAMATPRAIRSRLGPTVVGMKQRLSAGYGPSSSGNEGAAAYAVRRPKRLDAQRFRVVHVIANFMTGGSSRLVVDLIEHLGQYFEQSVVTSYIPEPPAYTGLEIAEFRHPEDERVFVECFGRIAPDFIHVHYWGDCDEPWYAKAIRAAELLGIPMIENVNTPVAPYRSPAISRYVFVSEYVQRSFGLIDPQHLTIHPGSDFSHFDRPRLDSTPEDCVGMVYRLEFDKLNEHSIEPFIRIVQKRPQTRVLIVGGGSLFEPFKEAVAAAGVADRFEFAGYVSYDTLPGLYRRLSVFVAPVWKESFGQVSLFAMNMRVPVIGYDVGAISEIVDDPGLIAAPADAEGLATIAIRLLDSRKLRREIGARQRARAQAHFSLQAMNAAYSKLYNEMIRLKQTAVE